MTNKTETRPSRQARGRESEDSRSLSQPFSNFTWKHGAVFMAAWVFMLAFITFSEVGLI